MLTKLFIFPTVQLFALLAVAVLGMLSSGPAFAQSKVKDPTRPPSVIAQQLAPLKETNTGFKLSAIFTRNEQRYAVVNGEILKTGDQIMGMKVANIDAFAVTLNSSLASDEDIVLQVQNSADMNKQVVK